MNRDLQRVAHLLLFAIGGGLVACGGRGSPSPTRSPPAQAAVAQAPRGDLAGGRWAELGRAERLDVMGLTVLPTMKALFQAHDAGAFAGFRCQTCHGDGFDKPPVDFRMPAGLPSLSATDPIGGAMAYDPETTRFMVETVVPTMARILGEQPFDPATGKGFNCFRCHPSS